MSLHHSSGRWRLGLGLSLLTAVLWGMLPIALTLVLESLDVYTVTWFRFLIAFTLLGLYLVVHNQFPSWKQLRSASLKLFAVATVFLAVNYLLFLQGLSLTSPANAQVLIQLAPVFLALGGLAVFREHYSRSQWIGLGMISFGLLLFFQDQISTLVEAPQGYLLGSGLLVLGAAAWAVYAMAQKQLLLKLSAAQVMVLIYGGSALLFSPTASPPLLGTLDPWRWGVLIFCGLNTLIAYGAFAEALDHWEASRVSAVLSLTPLFTLLFVVVTNWLWPTLLEPERMTLTGWLGALAVVTGSGAIALGQHRGSP
jgi:drug/metabolite transporter (DMT)-like permease